MCQGVCVLQAQKVSLNNAFSVLARTMKTSQGYRFPPHHSHLLKHALNLSAGDCTRVEPDLVYVCSLCVLHDLNSIAFLCGYLIEACFLTTYSVVQLL